MHRALQVDDILVVICSHFDTSTNSRFTKTPRQDRRALSAFAQCCTTFLEHGLNKLWRQTTLLRLLRILAPSGGNLEVSLKLASVTPENWARFQTYAKRVRILSISSRDRVSKDIFEVLVAHVGDKPLLPFLHELICARRALDMISYRTMFISPTLLVLQVHADSTLFLDVAEDPNDAGTLTDFIDRLASTSSQLSRMSFSGNFSVQFCRRLTSMHSLQDVDVGFEGQWKDADAFLSLAQLPSLVRLRISTHGLRLDPTTTRSPCFPRLSHLDISGSPATVNWILNETSSANLSSLRLSAWDDYPYNHWFDCFDALRSRHSSTLHRFILKVLKGTGKTGCTNTLEGNDLVLLLKPLTSLIELRDVYIDLALRMAFRGEHLLKMARAWPGLHKLHLWCYADQAKPGLSVLASFALRCPKLVSLAVPIDALLNSDDDGLQIPTALHPLKSLCILGSARIQSDVDVVHFLRNFFPHLRHLEATSWHQNHSMLWKKVERMLGVTGSKEASQWYE